MLQGKIEEVHWRGNRIADHWADLAAVINEAPWGFRKTVQWVDSTAWIIQSRLMHVLSFIERCPKVEKEQALAITYRGQMAEQGHELYDINHTTHACGRCGKIWHNCSRLAIKMIEPCPGPVPWHRPQVSDNPWVAPLGAELTLGRHGLNRTHHFAWNRGLLYCLRCEKYSSILRAGKLAHPCQMRPVGPGAIHRLRRLRNGQHPVSGKDFPMPSGTPPPSQILDGFSRGPLAQEENGIVPPWGSNA